MERKNAQLVHKKDAALKEILRMVTEARAEAARTHGKRPRIKQVITDVCKEYKIKKIPSKTVYNHLKDPEARTKLEDGELRRTLNPAEEATLISYIMFHADGGWALSQAQIEEAALTIAHVRNPSLESMGESWFRRFLARNTTVKGVWTKSLDALRAAAVNPTSMAHYFTLLERVMQHHNFDEELIYGVDESGFPFGGDETTTRVYGRKGSSVQHVQTEGNRENVTGIVCICTDGTYIRPTIIFKAKQAHSSWFEANVATEVK